MLGKNILKKNTMSKRILSVIDQVLSKNNWTIKDIDGYGRGDQLIYVNVWTPKNLSSEEKETLEALRNSKNFKPAPGKNEKGFFERMKEFF